MSVRLFVYGSLMRGESNAARLAPACYVGEARTAPRYALVDLGRYPALVPGGAAVAGELYDVDSETLGRLDAFEEHPDVYRRAPIALADGSGAEAYLLVASRRARPIPSGDWRRR